MPFYDYICKNCNSIEIDVFLTIEKSAEYLCLTCKKSMEKRITKFSFELKGDGFYKPSPSKKED